MTAVLPRATAAAGGHRVTLWRWARHGPALVLLHGFTGHAVTWDPTVARLTGGGSVLAPNLPGHDPLTPVDLSRGFAGAVEGLARCVAALGSGPVHLAGYSLGARLALGVGALRPELVERLTLVGVHPGLTTEAERVERRAADARWASLLRCEGLDTFLRRWQAQPLFASQAALPAEARARQDRVRNAHDPEQLARSLETVGLAEMPDYRPALRALDVPVRLVAGERDEKFLALAAEVAPLLPRGEVRIVPGAGHNVPLERPGDLAVLLAP